MGSIAQAGSVSSGLTADISQAVEAALVVRHERKVSRCKVRRDVRKCTTVKRVVRCGLPAPGSDVILNDKDGVSHYSGVWLCGSVWVCPVCGANVRNVRAKEVEKAALTGLEQGMGEVFGTWTLPHSAEDRLSVTLDLLAECRRWVLSQREVKEYRKSLGYAGSVVALEVTYGLNGWHPHVHALEFFERVITADEAIWLQVLYYKYADRFYAGRGWSDLSPAHGIKLQLVQAANGGELGRYLTKLQDGAGLGNEMTRSDLKRGRAGSMMPFEIFTEFTSTGDMAALDLWHEYEKAMSGKSSVRFTKGLRKRLLPDEPVRTDEDIANQEIGGVPKIRIDGRFYSKRFVVHPAALEGQLLVEYENGGVAAALALLRKYFPNEGHCYHEVANTS